MLCNPSDASNTQFTLTCRQGYSMTSESVCVCYPRFDDCRSRIQNALHLPQSRNHKQVTRHHSGHWVTLETINRPRVMMVQKLDNMMWRIYERPLNDVINVVGWSYSCRRGAAGTFMELTVRSYFKMHVSACNEYETLKECLRHLLICIHFFPFLTSCTSQYNHVL